MIGKIPVLGFALLTALSSQALAHEPCDSRNAPASYGYGYGYGGYAPAPPPVAPYAPAEYSGRLEAGLRFADLDRDGWITLDEALAQGRLEFQRNDWDRDRVLSPRELGHRGRHGHGHRRGLTFFDHQSVLRSEFARLDVNRDGVLGHYELGFGPPRPARSAGWWPYR